MQHHNQHPAKGHQGQNNKPASGILVGDETISSEAIERHIAEGKRLQAEAIAAFLRGGFARVAAVFQRHPAQAGAPARNSAVPHRA